MFGVAGLVAAATRVRLRAMITRRLDLAPKPVAARLVSPPGMDALRQRAAARREASRTPLGALRRNGECGGSTMPALACASDLGRGPLLDDDQAVDLVDHCVDVVELVAGFQDVASGMAVDQGE